MSSEPIHSLRIADVFGAMESSPEGLAPHEAEQRLSLYGANILSETPKAPLWQKAVEQLVQPLVIVLLIGGALAFIQGDILLGLTIWALVIFNAAFSFWREYRAEQAVEKLQKILPSYAHILRAGQDVHIPARDVVPGDILVLAEGDNIAADARVVEEYGLRTNNATLTGESIPARKSADPSFQPNISELEQPNLIFAGTSVASGTGRAVVYATGMLTQFGRIAHLTQIATEEKSPLQKELNRLTSITTWVAIGIGVVIFLVGYFELGLELFSLLLLTLGIIVAAIPEGLPATLTFSLAMAVQRLAQKGVLAKKLSIVETLGNISVICTDKSGTLTQNQMTVREIWVARQSLKVSGVGYEPRGEFTPDPALQPWEEDLFNLLDAASCCNNARLIHPTQEHPAWGSLGDQTEAALKVAALKSDPNDRALNLIYPRVHEIPFDARRKRMSTIHRGVSDETAFVKGAPREVLQLCTTIRLNNETVPLDNALRAEILEANDHYARNALRVLAVARRTLPPRSGAYTAESVEHDLTFLGLMAMMDPPRPEVEKAVQVCRQAGIRIVMITGDYGLTAESVARRVGLVESRSPRIITGAELDEMRDTDLEALLGQEVIFARMAPDHKMRLVAAFQNRGDVVAVTGDGVNDAPALRKADVGIAMGITGTDVAKEAADIIITNDDFYSIVSAIEEGRAIFDNIRKFMTYIFASNVPEIMPFVVKSIFPALPLALTVRQIIAIDLGTDFLPAVALGIEKPEPNVMRRPPRKRGQPLVDQKLLLRSLLWLGLIEAALCYVGFFSVYLFSGNVSLLDIPWLARLPIPDLFFLKLSPADVEKMAITVFHAGVVMAQVGNAFACRSEKVRGHHLGWLSNRYLLFGVIIEVIAIVAMIYWEPLARVFNHYRLPGEYWLGLMFFPLFLYGLEWIRKQLSTLLTKKEAG